MFSHSNARGPTLVQCGQRRVGRRHTRRRGVPPMRHLSFVGRTFGGWGWWRLLDERRRVASGGAGAPTVRAGGAVHGLPTELCSDASLEAADVEVDLADGTLPPLVAIGHPLQTHGAGPVVGAVARCCGTRRRGVQSHYSVGQGPAATAAATARAVELRDVDVALTTY